jgi:radical SAM protein with 4Fe4S-binding SPASM domain
MDCAVIPTLPYSEFARRLYDSAGEKRRPISMSLEVTQRCNAACVHCYQDWPAEVDGDLSTDAWFELLDEAADMGVLWLLITGGEPLVRRDFVDIYQHARKRGFITQVFTNGMLVDDDVADMFAEWAPYLVEVTLHSLRPEVFDRISGVPGGFGMCMDGIQRLMDRGVSLGLKSMVLRDNAQDVLDVQDWAQARDLPYRFDPHIIPGLTGGRTPLQTRLAPEQIVALDMAVPARLDDWIALNDRDVYVSPERVFTCGAGLRSFYVDAGGRVAACSMTLYDSFVWRPGTLQVAWDEHIPGVITRTTGSDYACGDCHLQVFCTRCAGWAKLEAGSETAAVPYLCELGRLRAEAVDRHRRTQREEPERVRIE